ncbi:MAG: threonine/serine exporter [Clostridiaceae bacterium]|nr:threonine/serine exporter [Clostridiaceae bacterium]
MIIHFIKNFILAFLGSIAPAIAMNIEKRLLLWTGLGGSVGYCIAYALNTSAPSLSISQIFIGTVTVAIFSELMAKKLKAPATVFCVPGIFPFLPGIAAYQTIQSLVENNVQKAVRHAVDTLFKAFTIAFGILIVTALFRLIRKKYTALKD